MDKKDTNIKTSMLRGLVSALLEGATAFIIAVIVMVLGFFLGPFISIILGIVAFVIILYLRGLIVAWTYKQIR